MPRPARQLPAALRFLSQQFTVALAALVFLCLAAGCGTPPSTPANLSLQTMAFRDSRDPATMYTCVVSDAKALLIVDAITLGGGKKGTRSFYATESMDQEIFRKCALLSGFAPPPFPANPNAAGIPPPAFVRWLYTNTRPGGHQPPPEIAEFNADFGCGPTFDAVRTNLMQKKYETKAAPNWVFVNEVMAQQLGVK